jgi:hypothetical protein
MLRWLTHYRMARAVLEERLGYLCFS